MTAILVKLGNKEKFYCAQCVTNFAQVGKDEIKARKVYVNLDNVDRVLNMAQRR